MNDIFKTLKTVVVLLFSGAILLFALQNLNSVEFKFITWTVELPLAIASVALYLLGAITGGILFSIIRKFASSPKQVESKH